MSPLQLHPLFQQVVDKLNCVDSRSLTADERVEKMLSAMPPPDVNKINELFSMVQEDEQIIKDGILLTITRPLSAGSQVLPAIVYLHGGGWAYGDAENYKRIRLELTLRASAAVVFVNYSLTPKVTYPVPLEECYTALSWIVDTDPSVHHLDPTKISVAGDSAGGNLAAALTILDKQRHGVNTRIQSQVLVYPITGTAFDTESYKLFGKGYMLTIDDMKNAVSKYSPDEHEGLTISTISPVVATVEELIGLPPALVITAEADVLRDEGEAYARKLIEAGVPVIATRVLSALHGFWTIDASNPISNFTLNQTVDYLHRQWGIRKTL